MITYYEELFPPNLRYTPYKSNNEHILDRIKFLDMKIYDLILTKDMEEENSEINNLINKLLIPKNILNEDLEMQDPEKSERVRILNFIEEYIKDREEVSKIANIKLSLLQIEEAFNMNNFLKTCLIIALAYEINIKYCDIFAYINRNKSMTYPNANIALKICGIHLENYNEYISSIGSLKALSDYIFDNKDILGDEKNDLIISLKLNKRVEKTLIKSNDIDYETPYYFNLFKADEELEKIQFNESIKEEINKKFFNTNKLVRYNTYKRCRIIFLKGPEGVGKKFYIKHGCKDSKRNILFIDVHIFTMKKDSFLELKKEIIREALIENAIPCLCNVHKLDYMEKESRGLLYSLLIELKNISELIFITSEEELYEIQESDYFSIVTVEIENPSAEIRSKYWKGCFEKKDLEVETDINILVNKFSFTPGQIKLLTNKIRDEYCLEEPIKINEQEIYEECNDLISNKLSNLCVFVKPMYTWDDLVLKKDQKEILRQACNYVKYKHIVFNEWKFNEKRAYGNGVCILFTGSPGTGKTMAAQVVANALNINMYKVDLSAITSKYIGETEKNIKKLFDEAKKSNAVLFFDEADTIFGKRTEVKDSNDKYANMDAAYLLQKIEEYEGISILATNYIQNIDEAFIRRISFIVRFSMPEFNERKLIWEKSFPAAMPLERELDFDFLASQFQLSGSNIKNIALHSAFLAAAKNEGLSMKYIINAIKTEYLKVNKILMKEDFGPYGDIL